MKTKHNLICEAPICMADNSKNWKKSVTWFPGEKVCGLKPFTRAQRTQNKLNKLYKAGKLKFPNTFYTTEILSKMQTVKSGTAGISANAFTAAEPLLSASIVNTNPKSNTSMPLEASNRVFPICKRE